MSGRADPASTEDPDISSVTLAGAGGGGGGGVAEEGSSFVDEAHAPVFTSHSVQPAFAAASSQHT